MAITKGSLLNKMFGWNDPRDLYSSNELDAFGMAQEKKEGAQMKYDLMRNQLANQAQAQAYQNVVLGGGGGGGSAGTWITATQPYYPNPDHFPLPALKMEDLDSAAGKASLEELKDLWRARWSDRWVKRGEINDEFYTVCTQRLLLSDRLEAHELADGTHVYRLIEK
jgi:hypothetical protein